MIGIDVGGTFTDLAMFDLASRRLTTVKVPSSPPEFWPSVVDALDRAGVNSGTAATVLHGTTVHLNAFLERKGARVALVTTKGFRDVYEMRRGNRPQPYDLHFRYPDPLVARRDIFEIDERTDAEGTILARPQPEALDELAKALSAGGYEAVVLCFLHSYRNPENEIVVADYLRGRLTTEVIAPSHEVCREWREYERTSTAVINGYASPVLKRYLADLLNALEGKATKLFLLQSNGGLMAAEEAGERGVLSLLSGPVGGNVASRALSSISGYPNLICIDMGGTSFEASLVVDGQSAARTEREVGGFPILAPMVDIHTIGAGGGSIAYSEHDALRVGPQSAGARPGPACYGHGGKDATVTDANMVVGRLEDGARFGELELDASLARQAVERLGQRFGLSGHAMAQGILDVINEQMANAIRTITVRRGIDPRGFALIAYGGAGPMHAADIARLLGVSTIIVPRAAGAFSAWGMLRSDLLLDHAETIAQSVATLDWDAIDARFAELEADLGDKIALQGVSPQLVAFERSLDVRYVGQDHALAVPVANSGDRHAKLVQDFDTGYLTTYGHSNPEEALEASTIRLRGIGRISLPAAEIMSAELVSSRYEPAPVRVRPVRFYGTLHDTQFIDRSAIPAGGLDGPCVVSEETCTTIVPPDFRCAIDETGNLLLTMREA